MKTTSDDVDSETMAPDNKFATQQQQQQQQHQSCSTVATKARRVVFVEVGADFRVRIGRRRQRLRGLKVKNQIRCSPTAYALQNVGQKPIGGFGSQI